jgi:hypothetical protein
MKLPFSHELHTPPAEVKRTGLTHFFSEAYCPQLRRITFHYPRRREQGMAVIVVMALVAILLIYLAGNLRTLYSLSRELKLLDQKQTRRLASATVRTNSLTQIMIPGTTAARPNLSADH